MGDNRAASVKLVCPKCKMRYAAISGQVRWCKCGTQLKPVREPKETK
jgi:hypothetical protein